MIKLSKQIFFILVFMFSTTIFAAGDYDNNGYLDIYVTNLDSGNGMMRNNGDGTFTNIAEEFEKIVEEYVVKRYSVKNALDAAE